MEVIMDNQKIKELADYVHHAYKDKKEIKKITSDLYPELTIEEAYIIQQELIRQHLEEGHELLGPKMGLTSEAKMKQMNVDDPIYGYVFRHMVEEGDVDISGYIHPKIEAEIAFVLSEDLGGPDVTAFDVLKATKFIIPAIEIIDSRYENFNFTLADVIADNTSAAGVVFGEKHFGPAEFDLDVIGVNLKINGELKDSGTSAAVLGNPVNSVARLARMLSEEGKVIKAGEPVLTGGITAAHLIEKGDHVAVKYSGIGEVSFFVK